MNSNSNTRILWQVQHSNYTLEWPIIWPTIKVHRQWFYCRSFFSFIFQKNGSSVWGFSWDDNQWSDKHWWPAQTMPLKKEIILLIILFMSTFCIKETHEASECFFRPVHVTTHPMMLSMIIVWLIKILTCFVIH